MSGGMATHPSTHVKMKKATLSGGFFLSGFLFASAF
jgi:hypothetical protein